MIDKRDGLTETLMKNGFVKISRLLTIQEVLTLRTVALRNYTQTKSRKSLEQDERIKFALTKNPETKNILIRIAHKPQILPVISNFQSDPFIEHTKSLIKPPLAPGTPWHQDAEYWKNIDPDATMLTLWVALSDCNIENGCLRLVKRSHQSEILKHNGDDYELSIDEDIVKNEFTEDSIISVPMQAGEGLLFQSKLLHGALPNSTTEPRLAIKMVFQDRLKRPQNLRFHKTKIDIPMMLDEIGGNMSYTKPFRKRLKQSGLAFGPPLSTFINIIERYLHKKRGAFTSSFSGLREFQIHGSDREWHQLFFYFELLQLTDSLPGDIAEFGVAGGISIISMARILKLLEPDIELKHRKMLYGFDSFEGLPDLGEKDHINHEGDPEMRKGGYYDPTGYQQLFEFAENEDNKVRLIRGWFNETLPVFLRRYPATSFSFIHIDCDLYESTIFSLNLVWDRLVPGGVIAFDELFHNDYPGETEAFREFSRGKNISIHKSRFWPEKKYLIKTKE